MDVTFLNVGYGESIVITEKEHCIVIDGGSADSATYAGNTSIRIGAFLRWQKISHIDLMIVTHVHDDHIGGLVELANEFEIGKICVNIPPICGISEHLAPYHDLLCASHSDCLFYAALLSYEQLLTVAKNRKIPVEAVCGESKPISVGSIVLTPIGMTQKQMEAEQEAFLAMLCEEDASQMAARYRALDAHCNATSLAFHVREGQCAALLSGDRVNGWDAFDGQRRLHANILKLTHHGQKDGIPEAMVHAAMPEAFVICADQDRTYDSAHPDVIQKACDYLRSNSLPERVFVTGNLQDDGGPACAVRFTLTSHAGITGITMLH